MATLRYDHACARCGGRHAPDGFCAAVARGRTGELFAGKYQLGARLGAGGMGEVYEARHTLIGRRVAIKLLLPQYARERDMLARFQREARAAGALESEHITAVTDFGFAADGAPYLVMEYLEGEDLARLAARAAADGAFEVERAVDLIIQACRGLAVAHRSGIIHRDLKPENLFVLRRSDGTDLLKILDFGIAKLRDTAEGPAGEVVGPGGETMRGTTRSGMALGTPCYMSPEQARGDHDIDHRTDLNALGVILYELLSGRKPHTGDSYNAILFHILTQIPEPLGRRREGLPPGLAEIVACAMAFDREGRYASAGDLAEALGPFGRAAGRRSTAGRAPTPIAGSSQATRQATPQITVARPDTGFRLAVAAATPAPLTPATPPAMRDSAAAGRSSGLGVSTRWALIGVGVGLAALAVAGVNALGPRARPAEPARPAPVVVSAPAREPPTARPPAPAVAPPAPPTRAPVAAGSPAPSTETPAATGPVAAPSPQTATRDRTRRRASRSPSGRAVSAEDPDSRDDLLAPRESLEGAPRGRPAPAAGSGKLLDFDSSNPYDR